ncbi:hypothetical protein AB0N61_16575 [Microbacterium sp. NPDC089320]|uniref:hypothetical protein n=1 Tax=Microbacterium sp. NPDC089320 TaxID=3155182 RepID=UPI0034493C2D
MEQRGFVRAGAALVPALVLLLSSCAPAAGTHPAPVSVAQEGAQSDAVDMLLSLDVSAVSTIIFQNTTDVGQRSAAVITGTVHRWLAGDKVTTATGTPVGAALLAEVEVKKVTKNDGTPLHPGDVIYIPVISPSLEPQEVSEALPRDLEVVAYLDDELSREQLQVSEEYRVEAGDADAAGKPRWPLLSPQGFIVTNPSDTGEQLWPFLGARATGKLTDVLPGGRLDGLTEEQRKLIVG